MSSQGYRMISVGKRKVAEHIYIMEKIIGRKMKGLGKEGDYILRKMGLK